MTSKAHFKSVKKQKPFQTRQSSSILKQNAFSASACSVSDDCSEKREQQLAKKEGSMVLKGSTNNRQKGCCRPSIRYGGRQGQVCHWSSSPLLSVPDFGKQKKKLEPSRQQQHFAVNYYVCATRTAHPMHKLWVLTSLRFMGGRVQCCQSLYWLQLQSIVSNATTSTPGMKGPSFFTH